MRWTILGCPLSSLYTEPENVQQEESDIAHHDIHLLLDLCQHGLVGNSDALQHMVRCVIHGGWRAHKIDVGESTCPPLEIAFVRKILPTV